MGLDSPVFNENTGTYHLEVSDDFIGRSQVYKVFVKPEGYLRKLFQTITIGDGENSVTSNTPLISGDTNGDGDIDIYDFTTVVEYYDKNFSSADFNRSGKVDIFDFTSVIGNYGMVGD